MIMITRTLIMIMLASLATLSQPASAALPPMLIPPPPSVKAHAYLLMDPDSEQVIAQKNADKRLPPASLTKMLSLYVISNALRTHQIELTDQVTISKNAWHTGGSRMFVNPGSKVSVKELIKGIIISSGNDACVAMAEYTAGSETGFVTLMNQAAKALHLNQSHFTSSTGLPHPNHYSTARDLAYLAKDLIYDFPEYYHWYKNKNFTFNHIKQNNRNRLLWQNPWVDGIKTGHTESAGFCIVASAKHKNTRFIAVVMGAPSDRARTEAAQALFNYGYRFYHTYKIYQANTAIASPKVWKGRSKHTPLGLKKDLYITIPSGQDKNLKAVLTIDKPLVAPMLKSHPYGTLRLLLAGKIIKTMPVFALDNNPSGHWLRRLSDKITMSVHSWSGKPAQLKDRILPLTKAS